MEDEPDAPGATGRQRPSEEPRPRPSGDVYDWLQRGHKLLAGGDAPAAATLLQHAHEVEPDALEVLETLARAEHASGRYEAARRHFAALVERAPDSDYARFGLGSALLRLRRAAAAEPHLALAVVMRPDNPEYLRLLERARVASKAREGASDRKPATPPPDGATDEA